MPKGVKLTKKQKIFAKEYLQTGNGTKSALKAYNTNNNKTASVIATENLEKPSIIKYLESKAKDASERIVELSNQDENLTVALGATKDILDRAGFKPVEKSMTLNIDMDAKEENPAMAEFRKQTLEKLRLLNENL
jgi:phage terminase small subunit